MKIVISHHERLYVRLCAKAITGALSLSSIGILCIYIFFLRSSCEIYIYFWYKHDQSCYCIVILKYTFQNNRPQQSALPLTVQCPDLISATEYYFKCICQVSLHLVKSYPAFSNQCQKKKKQLPQLECYRYIYTHSHNRKKSFNVFTFLSSTVSIILTVSYNFSKRLFTPELIIHCFLKSAVST